jgi:hypothetical protein
MASVTCTVPLQEVKERERKKGNIELAVVPGVALWNAGPHRTGIALLSKTLSDIYLQPQLRVFY